MGSSTYHLADALVGGIDAWIATRRATGRSWRLIARELYVTTAGRIGVTDETVRTWYEQRQGNGAAA